MWPSGLRRWIKAPVLSGAWVQIPPSTYIFNKYSIFLDKILLKIRYELL